MKNDVLFLAVIGMILIIFIFIMAYSANEATRNAMIKCAETHQPWECREMILGEQR